MSKKFGHLATQIGGVFGKVQRTVHDSKIRDGITRYEMSKDQMEKIIDRVKDTTPKVSGLSKNETLSETLNQTVSIYGEESNAAKTFSALAAALQQIGQEDRQLDKRLAEFCRAPLENFVQVQVPTFRREMKILDIKTLDMDGAKNENQKKPSEEAGTKEQETTVAYNQQKKTVEALIELIPTHYNVQAGCMKAFAQAKFEYHANVAKHLQTALQGMA